MFWSVDPPKKFKRFWNSPIVRKESPWVHFPTLYCQSMITVLLRQPARRVSSNFWLTNRCLPNHTCTLLFRILAILVAVGGKFHKKGEVYKDQKWTPIVEDYPIGKGSTTFNSCLTQHTEVNTNISRDFRYFECGNFKQKNFALFD